LKDFLTKLSDDLELLDRYRTNPKETLASSGLSASDQELLLSGDVAGIKKALNFGVEGPMVIIIIIPQ
jgi:hypothetical protein